MSEQRVDVVRRIYDDLSRGDLADVEAQLAAGVESDTQARGSDGADVDAFACFRVSTGRIIGYTGHLTWSAALEVVGLER
jgi:ketosteroid isomerase-like protein